jgi:pantoate kinase
MILIFLLVGILINRSAGKNWVRYVLAIPGIGWLMNRFFMPPTYYRIDTESMFQTAIHCAVQEVVDQMTAAKGLRALTELERKPILREFFQR